MAGDADNDLALIFDPARMDADLIVTGGFLDADLPVFGLDGHIPDRAFDGILLRLVLLEIEYDGFYQFFIHVNFSRGLFGTFRGQMGYEPQQKGGK